MKRDLPALEGRMALSSRTAVRFFGLADDIAQSHEPTQTQLDALETSYRSTGEYLAESPELEGMLTEIHVQGSRQLGTMVRPMGESREGFDIDLVARLVQDSMQRYGGEQGAARLLTDVYAPLKRYADRHGLGIKRWERCVTLEYAGGMYADITPIVDDPRLTGPYADTHGLVPDRKLQLFDSTNPRGYAKSFDQAAAIRPNFTETRSFSEAMDSAVKAGVTDLPASQKVFGRMLSRLVQLLKIHRNVAFSDGEASDLSPRSVFITTLAAAAYADLAPTPHESPLELLLDIVESMPRYFLRTTKLDGTESWNLPNPSAPRDNLASGMNDAARQSAFVQWHGRLVTDLREILHAIELRHGDDVVLKQVQTAFGSRSAQGIRQQDLDRLNTLRRSGRTAIYAAAAAPVIARANPHNFFGK